MKRQANVNTSKKSPLLEKKEIWVRAKRRMEKGAMLHIKKINRDLIYDDKKNISS